MNHFFRQASKYYPLRWFIIMIAVIASTLSYANVTGWRLMSFSGSRVPRGASSGSHYYHK